MVVIVNSEMTGDHGNVGGNGLGERVAKEIFFFLPSLKLADTFSFSIFCVKIQRIAEHPSPL